ncbi:hypothetical protein HDZ31DRAFT_66778 [Schizophyllum fasciatum]
MSSADCIHLGVGSDEVRADQSTSLVFTMEDILGPSARADTQNHDPIRIAVLKAFAIAHLGDALTRRNNDKGKAPIRIRPLPPTPPSPPQMVAQGQSAGPSRQGSRRRALPRLPSTPPLPCASLPPPSAPSPAYGGSSTGDALGLVFHGRPGYF